jgi:hypothetical protein
MGLPEVPCSASFVEMNPNLPVRHGLGLIEKWLVAVRTAIPAPAGDGDALGIGLFDAERDTTVRVDAGVLLAAVIRGGRLTGIGSLGEGEGVEKNYE